MRILIISFLLASVAVHAQQITLRPPATEAGVDNDSRSGIKLARLKYGGGGDWYNDPSSEVNLLNYVRTHTNIDVVASYEFVDLQSDNIFQYPLLFMTGHGTVNFSESEAHRLRSYLDNGGFLYIDDDYGMDESIRKELKKVFPDQELREIPFDHPIYNCHYDFSYGLPKIHEHDAKAPQGFGLFSGKRLCVFYTYESNPSDGWADEDVHHDSPEKREQALKVGTNIIVYALTY